MKKRMIVLMAAAGVLAAGCGEKGSGSGSGAEAGSVKTGIQPCDDYIAKMEACLPKMDPSVRAAIESGFHQTRESWKAAAARGGEKDQLKLGCEAALAAMPPNCK